MSAVAVESARQQWAEGHRRLNAQSADRTTSLRLLAQVEIVLDELNRRVGQTFTLAELADAYRDADRWLLDVLAPGPGASDFALAGDAAFHIYAHGAIDYAP